MYVYACTCSMMNRDSFLISQHFFQDFFKHGGGRGGGKKSRQYNNINIVDYD